MSSPPNSIPYHLPRCTLLIPNMHCPSCVESITSILSSVPQISQLDVSLLVRSVTFSIDTSIGGSLKPKSAAGIIAKVKELLVLEGGFVVEQVGQEVSSDRNEKGSTTDFTRSNILRWLKPNSKGRPKQDAEEERRAKHLAHCDVCQEEERNPTSASVAAVQDASESTQRSFGGVDVTKTILSISGMTCAACVQTISNSLRSDSRIISVDVDLLSSSGTIRHYAKFAPEDIAEEIEDLGYEAEVVSTVVEPSVVQKDSAKDGVDTDGDHVDARSTSFRTTFSVEGMTCSSCSNAISTALRDLSGIESVNIDVMGNSAVIVHSGSLPISQLIETIENLGYEAKEVSSLLTDDSLFKGIDVAPEADTTVRTIHIMVEGTYCHKCISQLNTAMVNLPIIRSTPFSLKDPSSKITYDPKIITIRQILTFLDTLAPEFESHILKPRSISERSRDIQAREVRTLAAHLVAAIVFAIPTFVVAVVGMILLPHGNDFKEWLMSPRWGAANAGTLILWPLATIIQFGVGRLFYARSLTPIYRKIKGSLRSSKSHSGRWSWRSLFNFGSMDLLVALSTSVAYFSSIAMLIIDVRSSRTSKSIGTYFDSSVFLIMFILLGRTLEAYARSRTTDAISLLGQLRPDTTLLVGGAECEKTSGSPAGHAPGSNDESANEKDEASVESPSDEETLGQTRNISVDHLEKDDLILVPPGSLPPTDGIVVSGNTTFDESSLTGESHPISKQPGDPIYTGTTNLSSAITIRVTSLPTETMLDNIIGAVSNASAHKAPIEKLAERLTGVFVPVIVYISLIVLITWLSLALTGHLSKHQDGNGGAIFYAIEFAIATLVVACPCGIGLAVPCANAVGNGLAAKAGILASGGGEAFLAATKVGTVVLDKTGTLTEGKSRVTDERHWLGDDEWQSLPRHDLEKVILDIERGSTHPLAKGLVEFLESKGNKSTGSQSSFAAVLSSEEIAGRGIRATVKPQHSVQSFELLIGNPALLSDHHLVLSTKQISHMEQWFRQAKSVVLVAIKSSSSLSAQFVLTSSFALSDPPRQSAQPILSQLQKSGIRIMMLSGDAPSTARAVAKMVGIPEENVRAGVGPIEKANTIKELQEGSSGSPYAEPSNRSLVERVVSWTGKGRNKSKQPIVPRSKIMFVGDGLNDAVALAAADVSVAMGHGSQAVLAGSDFVLLSSTLSTLPTLFKLSKKVYNRQRLNLLWAIMFNTVCIPFAAGIFYPAGGIRLTPVWSAVLMALSSVSVVLSSLAMRWGV
ncbi:E1-E2 ATPase-domain-containing protein [Kockovaella imperatae]|uniref:E1-E2 ATPase-domain-containing protein n=1 Tax=Kockovaella imperatae TaxID=4999 RepID=A0A1Y1UJM1_9TREE|nr:E1-E2 ATPase-domain-containing protein [Kockovaella imperatae]ORX37325.1 E1-E2 ATPase-domain-containing protein [Kockovaella imperatae]